MSKSLPNRKANGKWLPTFDLQCQNLYQIVRLMGNGYQPLINNVKTLPNRKANGEWLPTFDLQCQNLYQIVRLMGNGYLPLIYNVKIFTKS